MPLAMHDVVANCIAVHTSGSGLESGAAIAGSAIQPLVSNVNKVQLEIVSFRTSCQILRDQGFY